MLDASSQPSVGPTLTRVPLQEITQAASCKRKTRAEENPEKSKRGRKRSRVDPIDANTVASENETRKVTKGKVDKCGVAESIIAGNLRRSSENRRIVKLSRKAREQ
jgi:hypothetical protein